MSISELYSGDTDHHFGDCDDEKLRDNPKHRDIVGVDVEGAGYLNMFKIGVSGVVLRVLDDYGVCFAVVKRKIVQGGSAKMSRKWPKMTQNGDFDVF